MGEETKVKVFISHVSLWPHLSLKKKKKKDNIMWRLGWLNLKGQLQDERKHSGS